MTDLVVVPQPGDPLARPGHHPKEPTVSDRNDEPTFEELLADTTAQFDPNDELLPHLIAFGPPKSSRPWLFDAATNTTVAPWTEPQ